MEGCFEMGRRSEGRYAGHYRAVGQAHDADRAVKMDKRAIAQWPSVNGPDVGSYDRL